MGRGGYHGGSTIIGPRSVGWFGGRGSVTSQSNNAGRKAKVRTSKPKKKRKGPKPGNPAAAARQKGNGVTIPEQVSRAKKRVRAVEAEVAKTKQQLAKLEQQLAEAKQQLHRAENLPRRSALGQALVEALVSPQRS
jgi:chromosome segregation ATPase